MNDSAFQGADCTDKGGWLDALGCSLQTQESPQHKVSRTTPAVTKATRAFSGLGLSSQQFHAPSYVTP